VNHALNDIAADFDAENVLVQRDFTGIFKIERVNCEFHDYSPCSCAACASASTGAASACLLALAAAFRPAGLGASWCSGFFVASETRTQPLSEPGTVPLTITRLSSTSIPTTSSDWVVT